MLTELVGEDGELGVADRRVKPSLLVLAYDQAALIDAVEYDHRNDEHGLRRGFPNRRRFIEWYQRAAVRTIGHIAEYLDPRDLLNDEVLVAAATGHEDLDPRKAATYRHMVEAKAVHPACNRAYRSMRDVAANYQPEGAEAEKTISENKLDPVRQRNIAMRPGFNTLDRQQSAALEKLWGGFETTGELLDWFHALNSPSNGEIPDSVAEETLSDDVAIDRLVSETETREARVYRELLACSVVLPAFVDGVKLMDTDELAALEREGSTTMRMEAK